MKLTTKRLQKEIQLYSQENFQFPNLFLRYNDQNLFEWYFLVHGLIDTPFEKGIYFGKVMLPKEYPLKAPDFIFITPNGRFEINKKICTTFSAFHQETYTSTWNILSMMEGLISFMTDKNPEPGIGSIETSLEEKQSLASQSLQWNLKNAEFNSIFPDIYKLIET